MTLQTIEPTELIPPETLGVAATRRLLAERFPACFQPHKSKLPKRPLKIGIHQDLAHAMPTLSADAIGAALAEYTRGPRYLREAVLGAVRIDLDGMPAGEVTEVEAKSSRSYLKATLKKIDAKRAAKKLKPAPAAPEPASPAQVSPEKIVVRAAAPIAERLDAAVAKVGADWGVLPSRPTPRDRHPQKPFVVEMKRRRVVLTARDRFEHGR